jgi:hypothetical protein
MYTLTIMMDNNYTHTVEMDTVEMAASLFGHLARTIGNANETNALTWEGMTSSVIIPLRKITFVSCSPPVSGPPLRGSRAANA